MTPHLVRRYTIAGVEIFGGLYGLAMTASAFHAPGSAPWLIVLALILLFFATSLVAGSLLLRDRDLGASLSLYLQVPQILFVYSGPLVFHIYCGFSASLALTTPLSLKLSFDPGSLARFTVDNDLPHMTLGLNAVALLTLWQLYAYMEVKDGKGRSRSARTLGGTI